MPADKVSHSPRIISNISFLQAIFGDEWGNAHVTAFADDPSDIPNESRARCWAGGYAKDRLDRFKSGDNQYFTISLFHPEGTRAVRRKGNFDATFVIVADDVAEKIPVEQAQLLPEPSYKLNTSANSEQWGWILTDPVEDRAKVEALVDGLVAQGLCPDGKDTGMKGVTRFVRLPEGSNTKKKRFVSGKPFRCYINHWKPELTYTLEELAVAFAIDLNVRAVEPLAQDAFTESELQAMGHPLTELVSSTGHGADGWIRIDCINAKAHTDADASGAAYRVLKDGSVQYQCHHGHCDGVTGRVAVAMLDDQRDEGGMLIGAVAKIGAEIKLGARRTLAEAVGKEVSEDVEQPAAKMPNVFDDHIFVAPLGVYYNVKTRTQTKPANINQLFKGIYAGTGSGANRKPSFTEIHAEYVAGDPNFYSADGLGWFPTGASAPDRAHLIYSDDGQRLINEWKGFALSPIAGDITPWLDHVYYLIPDKQDAEFFIDYCASLVQRLDVKPNFCVLMRGPQGNGKDLILKPLGRALGHPTAQFAELDQVINNWGDYLSKVKMLVLQEVNAAQNKRVANDLKLLLASNGSGRRSVNMKGQAVRSELDLCGVFMMTNHANAVAIEANDRRYFVVDMPSKPKDKAYYDWFADTWMRDQNGAAVLLDFLLKRDISNFSSQSPPPKTAAFYSMVEGSRYEYEQSLEDALDSGSAPFNGAFVTYDMLMQWKRENQVKGYVNDLKEVLKKHGWSDEMKGASKVDGVTKKTKTFYVKLSEVATSDDLETPKGRWDFYNKFKNALQNG